MVSKTERADSAHIRQAVLQLLQHMQHGKCRFGSYFGYQVVAKILQLASLDPVSSCLQNLQQNSINMTLTDMVACLSSRSANGC